MLSLRIMSQLLIVQKAAELKRSDNTSGKFHPDFFPQMGLFWSQLKDI